MNVLDSRRRRALWRATHRGTKEMDWLLGRYAEARLAAMDEADLAGFERLLILPDPDLQEWILAGTLADGSDVSPLIERIRAFHGIATGNPT